MIRLLLCSTLTDTLLPVTTLFRSVMVFVAWFWAYFDASLVPSSAEVIGGAWPPVGLEVIDPFGLPLLTTLILLCSGTTITWAHHALIHGDREGAKKGLWCIIGLGVGFSAIQAFEYYHAPFRSAARRVGKE